MEEMEIASPNTRTSVGPKQSTAQGVKESLPEARRPGLEFNVSFLPCCERKNEWSYTSPPPRKTTYGQMLQKSCI